MNSETIAAIATSMTNSGIGIIRVSGNEAITSVNHIYCNPKYERTLKKYKTHTIHYGYIFHPGESDEIREDMILDEVMVSIMKAPNSYTREDTVEINCHGGVVMMNEILRLIIQNGVRIAQPGEFTKRAFLNGRIDLTRAEAVMDIIDAKNKYALSSSVKQLKGSVYEIVKNMRDQIIYEIAFIESALDDPEHISLDGYPEKLNHIVTQLSEKCRKLLETTQNGKILKEGINTVIVGKPNAGKSSLLNLMLGEEKAIVTNIAGTTRDVLEESITLGGINLNIIDTAGIRNTQDIVEKIGVEKAKKYAADADLIIYVCDASVPFDENDEEIFELLYQKKVIILLNKSDLQNVITEDMLYKKLKNRYEENKKINKEINNEINNEIQSHTEEKWNVIKTSTLNKTGITELEDTIRSMFLTGKIEGNSEVFLTNLRHIEAIENTMKSLEQVKNSLALSMPEDFYSIDLMSAYASLGSIIGEEVSEDLVNEIFSKFCMGK